MFSEKLIRLRIENAVTQEELARRLNISSQTVRRWEYGETHPDIYQLKLLCEIFKVQPQYFLEEDSSLKGDSVENNILVNSKGKKAKYMVSVWCVLALCLVYCSFIILTIFLNASYLGNNAYGLFGSIHRITYSFIVFLIITCYQFYIYKYKMETKAKELKIFTFIKIIALFLLYCVPYILLISWDVISVFIISLLVLFLELIIQSKINAHIVNNRNVNFSLCDTQLLGVSLAASIFVLFLIATFLLFI